MLFITFHGSDEIRNVAAYKDDGTLHNANVLSPKPKVNSELRSLAFVPNGDLWVVSGGAKHSEISCYKGSGASLEKVASVIEYEAGSATEALWHPFDFTFSADKSTCFVANQDTNVVAWYATDSSWKKLTPLAPNPKLPLPLPPLDYLESTFVASSCGNLPNVRPTNPVPIPEGGLDVHTTGTPDEKIDHSVRGVLSTNGALYVADEPGNAVRVYAPDGTYLQHGQVFPLLPNPVHLAQVDDYLLVSASDGVYAAQLIASDPTKLLFKRIIKLDGAAGMAYSPQKLLYVVNRKKSFVHVYQPNGLDKDAAEVEKPFSVLQNPEFVLHVPDS